MFDRWYRFSDTDKKMTYERQGQEVKSPIKEKIYFDDPVVDSFSLEPKNKVPMDQNFTAVSNYFLDYWGNILGMDAAYTWIRYVRYVYRANWEPNFSLTKMAKIMGIAINTLKKYLGILETYGFVAIFYKDTKSLEKNREVTKTLIRVKVRKSIPFLTPDLVELLPPDLKAHHSRDLAEYEKTGSINHEELRGVDEIFGLNTGHQNLTAENEDLSTSHQILTTENTAENIHTPSNFDATPRQNLTPKENSINTIGLNCTELGKLSFEKTLIENGFEPESRGSRQIINITSEEGASSDQLAETLQQLNEQVEKGVFIRNEFGWIRNKLRELIAQEETYIQRQRTKPYQGKKVTKKEVKQEEKLPNPDKYKDFYL